MKSQLDIFGADGAADEGAQKPGARQKRARGEGKRTHEVKKAPMLVDAFGAEQAPSPHPSPSRGEGEGGGDQGIASSSFDGLRAPRNDTQGSTHVSDPEAASTPRIFTISEITNLIKDHLESEFIDVWVSGEVTDFRGRNGKHLYFALKDESCKIRAIIFGAAGRPLPFQLEDGLKLICRGRLNVYGPQGSYSLIIDPEHCEPEGLGALKLAFEQLKKRLEAEGLFARERKRAIPYLPRRIGIITAPTGAAVRDMIHVLTRRFPNIEILLHPVRVQGEGAAAEIADAIAAMNYLSDIDVLIVGRGGGSIEDLWAFNEEAVARAIAASRIPVISAVGHEIDFTISDFVADLRAATPSAAAELAVPVREELVRTIADYRERLAAGLKRILENRWLVLKRAEGRLGDPGRRLPDLMLRVDGMRERISNAIRVAADRREQQLAKLMSNLDHLSPLGVLAKGYAVVEGPDGRAVRDSSSLKVGDSLGIRFSKGSARTKVTGID